MYVYITYTYICMNNIAQIRLDNNKDKEIKKYNILLKV